MHKELRMVIGPRKHMFSDRNSVPYFNACIELLRYSSVLHALPHSAEKDTHIKECRVPKGICLLVKLFDRHHEKYFNESWEFKPERFQIAEGKAVPRQHEKEKQFTLWYWYKSVFKGAIFEEQVVHCCYKPSAEVQFPSRGQ